MMAGQAVEFEIVEMRRGAPVGFITANGDPWGELAFIWSANTDGTVSLLRFRKNGRITFEPSVPHVMTGQLPAWTGAQICEVQIPCDSVAPGPPETGVDVDAETREALAEPVPDKEELFEGPATGPPPETLQPTTETTTGPAPGTEAPSEARPPDDRVGPPQ